jgi:hypothetical protein
MFFLLILLLAEIMEIMILEKDLIMEEKDVGKYKKNYLIMVINLY